MMLAVNELYGLLLVAHIVFALLSIVNLLVMRTGGHKIAKGAELASLSQTFRPGIPWGLRNVHMIFVTGILMIVVGGNDVSFSQLWVQTALLSYVLAAGHLEARLVPEIGRLSRDIQQGQVPPALVGKKFIFSIDIVLGLIGIGLIAMVTQL